MVWICCILLFFCLLFFCYWIFASRNALKTVIIGIRPLPDTEETPSLGSQPSAITAVIAAVTANATISAQSNLITEVPQLHTTAMPDSISINGNSNRAGDWRLRICGFIDILSLPGSMIDDGVRRIWLQVVRCIRALFDPKDETLDESAPPETPAAHSQTGPTS